MKSRDPAIYILVGFIGLLLAWNIFITRYLMEQNNINTHAGSVKITNGVAIFYDPQGNQLPCSVPAIDKMGTGL